MLGREAGDGLGDVETRCDVPCAVARGELERIFEPFQASDESEGSGLGLAIARGFVEANGGRLVSEPTVGKGAVFVLQLPVEPIPAAAR